MSENPELKMWLMVRSDIDFPIGKLAAQAGHGFVSAILEAKEDIVSIYMENAQPKITVRAKNEAALERAYKECKESGLPCSIITDAGRTVFNEPTKTVACVGPCYYDDLPKFVQRMQLL